MRHLRKLFLVTLSLLLVLFLLLYEVDKGADSKVRSVSRVLIEKFYNEVPEDERNFRTEADLDMPAESTRELLHTTVYTTERAETIPAATVGPIVNPGCISRRLQDFRPVKTGAVYHHPPIVQYAKLSTGRSPVSLTFMDYIAMMSAYKLLKPERIVIHTYTDIHGKYWNLTQRWENTTVQMNKVSRFGKIGNRRKGMPISHQADYVKLSGLLEFGGVVSDFDVIIVNGTKLKQMQSISECVLSREGEIVNIGFSSCIENSSFVQQWLDTYHKDYRPHLWLHNSAFKPTDILEKDTTVCYNMYLVWDIATNPTYSKAEKVWLKEDGVKWEEKVAAHYFNRKMRQFDEHVLIQTHSFGKMLRYISDS